MNNTVALDLARGPLMIDIASCELNLEEKEQLSHSLVGSVILFSRNFSSPEQLEALTQSIKAIRSPELLIAVDQEGGRVQRFKSGFTKLPAAREIQRIYSQNNELGIQLARSSAFVMAFELRRSGVDLSFAPVVDINHCDNSVIGDRSFGTLSEVKCLARAYMLGMKEAGMASVGKHYPGHGAVREDSHLELPEDKRSLDELLACDLNAFQSLIDAGLDAVMSAHVLYSNVDTQIASYSKKWLENILRGQMGFDGIIFSDDLTMKGSKICGDLEMQVKMSLSAGCDIAIICNDPDAVRALLNKNQPLDAQYFDRAERALKSLMPSQRELDQNYYEESKALLIANGLTQD